MLSRSLQISKPKKKTFSISMLNHFFTQTRECSTSPFITINSHKNSSKNFNNQQPNEKVQHIHPLQGNWQNRMCRIICYIATNKAKLTKKKFLKTQTKIKFSQERKKTSFRTLDNFTRGTRHA